MSKDYRIKAFPTEYRGRVYRSRLEARWAAFFDQLNWRHEYEPYDLGAWSPDFLLPDLAALVEVKPVTEFDPSTYQRMRDAAAARGLLTERPDEGAQIQSLIQLGVSPVLDIPHCHIGWWGNSRDSYTPHPARLVWGTPTGEPRFAADIGAFFDDGYWTASGDAGPRGYPEQVMPRDFCHHTMDLWARATGLVQWKPKK